MSSRDVHLTGHERYFDDNELIVSKTDMKGRITYANDVFLRVGGFTEQEILGAPHSILRHPEMPRCVFKLLWDQIGRGSEIFAYVINRAKNGDHYWVFAHVTPTYGADGNVVGYHSNRRSPRPDAIKKVKPLYADLLAIENRASDRKAGMDQSTGALVELLSKEGTSYDQFALAI